MSRAVVLRIEPDCLTAVIARGGGRGVVVDAVASVRVGDVGAVVAAKRLADELAPYRAHRLPVVLAVERDDLQWQSYELPPAPAEELPDMVLMQAARDFVLADDSVGLDFLPLEGDQERPHRVLMIGMPRELLLKRAKLCEAAGLKLRRAVPACFGWPSLMRSAAAGGSADIRAGLAVAQQHAELWACRGNHIRLMRSVHLMPGASTESAAAILGSELRRTLMALAQLEGQQPVERMQLYGDASAAELSDRLNATLPVAVEHVDVNSVIDLQVETPLEDLADLAPLAALAADEGAGVAPPIDLMHPRRRPTPPSRRTTYALAGIAAALLAAMVGWRGYRNVVEPLEAAELARAKAEALADTLAVYEDDQQAVDQIQQWFDVSVDVLDQLERVGMQSRVKSLDDDDFPIDQDIVINRFEIDGRSMTLQAFARDVSAVQPLEQRLRDSSYEANRGPVDADGGSLPDYKVLFEEKLLPLDVRPGEAGL